MSELTKLLEGVKVEWKNLGEVSGINRGFRVTKRDLKIEGKYPVVSGGVGFMGYVDEFNREADTITIAQYGSAGYVKWQKEKFWANDVAFSIFPINNKLNKRFLYHFLISKQEYLYSISNRIAVPYSISKEKILKLGIPIPCPDNPEKSLKIQEGIVRVLDSLSEETNQLTTALQKELELHQKQYNYYREELFKFRGKEVEWKALRGVAENLDAMRKPVKSGSRNLGEIPYYGASGIVDYVKDYIFEGDFLLISEDGANLLSRSTPIAFSISGKSWVNNHAHILKFESHSQRRLIEYYLNSIDLEPYITGAAQPKLNQKNLNIIKVPVPDSTVLEYTVKILDELDASTKTLTKAVQKEVALRNKQYEYYRDRLLLFPSLQTEAEIIQ